MSRIAPVRGPSNRGNRRARPNLRYDQRSVKVSPSRRYDSSVARWLTERFPDSKRGPDGSVQVTHRVVEPEWLVRMVLQYGEEAEVVEPQSYRQLLTAAFR